jgi:two-component system response regulator
MLYCAAVVQCCGLPDLLPLHHSVQGAPVVRFFTEPEKTRRRILEIKRNDIEILLVEDNPNDVELTLRGLKKKKLANKVHVVNDGEQALDYIFTTGRYSNREINDKPKLILLNLKLPKVDGLEVLRKIKSDDRTKIIPVVVLTSSKEERENIESYKLGVNSYITKPIDFAKFLNCVEDLGLYWLLINKSPIY